MGADNIVGPIGADDASSNYILIYFGDIVREERGIIECCVAWGGGGEWEEKVGEINNKITTCSNTAPDISTGPLARRTFQTAGPVRASTFYLSLARTGHLDICRATIFQIVLARTMTIHSMYFSRGRPSHISAVFAQPFCYSETPACRESKSGMSIKHTDVSV